MDGKKTICIQLNYPLERVKEPILYRLIKDFGLIPNIRRANIEIHSGGFIEMELTGNSEALEQGLSWIETCGVTVQKNSGAS